MPNGRLRQANLKMLFERARQYENASFKGLFNFINFIDKLQLSSGDMSSAKIIGESENVVRIMSIHKSKGLEFPVVFLCGTGKQFNLQDLNQNIILHQDLGFGPKYINEEKRIEYSTLAKEAVRLQAKIESMSEEMRVLYVALTRAKEKIIITGVSKNIEKSLVDKEELLELYNSQKSNKISNNILKKYNSYLDWVELVWLKSNKLKQNMKMEIHKKLDILNKLINNKTNDENDNMNSKIYEKIQKVSNKEIEELKQDLEWKYKYIKSSTIPTKTSISKINQEFKKDICNVKSEYYNKNIEDLLEKPKFLNDSVTLTKAEKGTLMHLCFQKIDEKKEYNLEDIKEFIKDLLDRELITKQESEAININSLYKYTKSELWKKLNKAKKIFKEQAFYINIKSGEIYNDNTNEDVLVQGVIDLYFIDENNKLILVDFKTDYIKNEQELIERYKYQVELYEKALEKAINKSVDNVYLYSVYLDKLIKV